MLPELPTAKSWPRVWGRCARGPVEACAPRLALSCQLWGPGPGGHQGKPRALAMGLVPRSKGAADRPTEAGQLSPLQRGRRACVLPQQGGEAG